MLRLLGSLPQPLEPAGLHKCLLLPLRRSPTGCLLLPVQETSSLGAQELGREGTVSFRPRPPVSGNAWLKKTSTELGAPRRSAGGWRDF